MDDSFRRPERRPIRELNIVPIIDMFTTVVFFLLLSTSFIALTKLTVPPSAVSTISDPVAPPPLAPKIIVYESGQGLSVSLSWAGRSPGVRTERSTGEKLLETTRKIAADFNKAYPSEKSIQVGLASRVKYQHLISVMDGVRDVLPDVVLISYQEVEHRAGQAVGKGQTL